MNRYVVIGAAGQLGFDLMRTFDLPGEVLALTHADIELREPAVVRSVLGGIRPTHVLNTAAYNPVDRAEDERAAAFALNAEAVETLAEASRALGATLVHFSTDYVFDGAQRRPYRESDAPAPLSVYGESKLAGERLARERCPRSLVVRASGLFGIAKSSGKGGTNFVETMLRLAREGRPLRVVADQVLGPSYTLDVAAKVWQVVAADRPGLYHVSSAGETSWYDFAREVFRLAGLAPDLTPVTSVEYAARARRPLYSVLAHEALQALGLDDLRPWPEALAAYLAERPA